MGIEKHFLTIVCLLSSLIGISLIYYSNIRSRFVLTDIGNLNHGMIGLTTTIKGEISKVRFHQNGHIFLTISDGTYKIQVPLFASFLKSSGVDIGKLRVGTKVLVSGTVDLYNNQLQIIPKKVGYIKILGG